jgi:WD40 repeat protein
MKEMKPKFELSRIFSDGTKEPAQIVPLSEALKAKMNRRGFLGAGLTATAAVLLLDGCGTRRVAVESFISCDTKKAHDTSDYNYDSVPALAMYPNGKMFFSGGLDRTIKMWSLPEGAHIKTLTGHSEWIRTLAVSLDEKRLFSGSDDITMTGHSEWIRALAVSPDGKQLFSGSDDKTIKIWSLPDGTLMKTIPGHQGYVLALAVSPDSKWLVSSSFDNTIKIWSLPDGTLS